MYKILFILFFILNGLIECLSQNKYNDDIDFLSLKLKTVYAGYKESLVSKEFDNLVSSIKSDTTSENLKLLSKLVLPFKDLHLVLYDLNLSKIIDTNKCEHDKKRVFEYLKNKNKSKDRYEGFWISDYNNCIIGIVKSSNVPLNYDGYIIETKTKLVPGYKILSLEKSIKNYYETEYTEENLGYRVFINSNFRNSKTLLLNSYGKWKKMSNYKSGFLDSIKIFSHKPELHKLDSNNILLRMPNFGSYNIKVYDSIINRNDSLISKTKTLIIDLRNNTGGTINNYLPLLKYIYTDPIIHCGGYILCSDYLIQDLQNDIKIYQSKRDSVKLERAEIRLKKMFEKRGSYLLIPPDTLLSNIKVESYPKNVAIIVNANCVSAAELMLLDFKQSKKVKIFGENTGGAVDYLDDIEIELPESKYSLYIATTKRLLKGTDKKYDNIGIKPDVLIPESSKNWVDFVKKFYEIK